MNLVPLYEEAIQFNNYNGVVLAAGKVEVWYLGRTRLADIYSDVAGEVPLQNPFNLNDLGMQEVYVNPAFNYTLVVYDAYNSELFSIDKYIQGAGDHNTSNVAVQPSEHIGVSAWTVGDVQIYQPYIQGELGKTYHGVEPVVVNNQYNLISARNIPLGVQEPLYFAEDSESACVIGMSGDYQPVTGMSGYATTGDLVDLTESISETYQPKGDYATHDDLSGFMEESKLETAGGKITGYDGTAFAGGGSVDPSEFIPWSASGNFATPGDLNGKLDTTAFSTVSGDFITALPEGLLNESGFEYDGDKISAYNGSAFVGQGGGGITGEYELSAGNGISIENFPIEQKTVISVSGDYITKNSADTLYQPIGDYATTASVAEKLDTTAFSNVSGNFLTSVDLTPYQTTAGMTAYQPAGDYLTTGDSANFYTTANESGFITGVDLTPYQTVEGMTAYQEKGDYYSASNPSGFITGVDLSDYATTAEVADKMDITGMTAYQEAGDYYSASNPSGFITGVDLTPYQLTADMTAYQPVGDYLTTADSANFYTTANESGYLTAVPDTYLQNTDLSTTDGKVTAISGIPLSAGGDVPEGVMVESGLEYNAVNEISAYNGSAIAQYGAEKQWLVHDDTLVHASNSAQYALGVNLSAVAQLLGVDETLLWSGIATTGTLTATESVLNFDHYKVYISERERGTPAILEFHTENTATSGENANASNGGYKAIALTMFQNTDADYFTINSNHAVWNDSFTELSLSMSGWNKYMPWTASGFRQWSNTSYTPTIRIHKIIGIGRKA